MSGRGKGKRSAQGGLATAGVAALAVVCCAALPLVIALAGSVAIGTVLGVGVGVAAAAVWPLRSSYVQGDAGAPRDEPNLRRKGLIGVVSESLP